MKTEGENELHESLSTTDNSSIGYILVMDLHYPVACTNKMWMKTYKIGNNDLAAITFKPRNIYWNKPTIVGATVLDLSRRQMYWFQYKHIRANFKTLVLYSNTDSSNYEIESVDLYEDLNNNDAIYQE